MPSFIASAVLALAALPAVLGVPLGRIQPPSLSPLKFTGCTVTAKPSLPANQTLVVLDSTLKTHFVGLGVGVQNYTCTDGKYVSAGAVATLYDVSCVYGTPLFSQLPDIALKFNFQRSSISTEIGRTLGKSPLALGDHYFVTNSAGGISPKFDFTKSQSASTFVVAAKKGNVASPAGSENVDWLQLNKVEGTMGAQVFRIDTRKGQPPASCTSGTLSVPYSAMYWVMDA
jgi:hypothetical protein